MRCPLTSALLSLLPFSDLTDVMWAVPAIQLHLFAPVRSANRSKHEHCDVSLPEFNPFLS